MRIARTTAAPVPVRAGNTLILLSPPTLRDFGLIYRMLADRFGTTPDGSPAVVLGDPQAAGYFEEPAVLAALLWAVARRDQPDMTLDRANDLIQSLAGDPDRGTPPDATLAPLAAAVVREVFSRPDDAGGRDLSHWKRAEAGARPLHLVNFGKLLERADVSPFDPVAVAGWTIDQLTNKLAGGTPDEGGVGVPLNKAEADDWFRRMNEIARDPAKLAELRQQRAAEDAAEMAKRIN